MKRGDVEYFNEASSSALVLCAGHIVSAVRAQTRSKWRPIGDVLTALKNVQVGLVVRGTYEGTASNGICIASSSLASTRTTHGRCVACLAGSLWRGGLWGAGDRGVGTSGAL